MKEYVFRINKEIKSCANCPCKQIYRYKTECNLLLKETVRNGRLEDCPLARLSEPHGALKDEMYVINEIDRQFGGNEKTSDIAQDIQGIIMSAPTILEASK